MPRPSCTGILLACLVVGGSSARGFSDLDSMEPRRPVLVQPASGAQVTQSVTVRIGYAGHGPQGLADGSGIPTDPDAIAAPSPAAATATPDDDSTASTPIESDGPSDGTGLSWQTDTAANRPHFALLIDADPPDPGAAFVADARHVAFPAGIPQMTVKLRPGSHRLALLILTSDGAVAKRFRPPAAVLVTVK